MKARRVLILEDDLATLQAILGILEKVAGDVGVDFVPTVLSEYTQVLDYLNMADQNIYDIILLDRDCHAGGSFHCLDFAIYPIDKVIGISSVPEYNKQLTELGVTRVITKNYEDLSEFVKVVERYIRELTKRPLQ